MSALEVPAKVSGDLRKYRYNPDPEWLKRRYARDAKGLKEVQETLERPQSRSKTLGVAIDQALAVATYLYAFQEAPQLVARVLELGCNWIDEAVDHLVPGENDASAPYGHWLSISLLAGRSSSSEKLAGLLVARPPRTPTPSIKPWPPTYKNEFQLGDHYHRGVAFLLLGDRAAALVEARHLTDRLAGDKDSIRLREVWFHSDAALSAVCEVSRQGLEQALAAWDDHSVKLHKRSVEWKRKQSGLLDVRLGALAVLARRAGLIVPDDIPNLGADLLPK